jgi:hypothetical protein
MSINYDKSCSSSAVSPDSAVVIIVLPYKSYELVLRDERFMIYNRLLLSLEIGGPPFADLALKFKWRIYF